MSKNNIFTKWALFFALAIFWNVSFAMNCPNIPAGATTLATVHFNTSDGEGQLWEIYPGAGQIRQPSGSEGSASASILPAGAGSGGQQTIWPKPGNQQPLNNLYTCFRWKMSAGFLGLRTNNKLYFQSANNFTYGKDRTNGFFGVGKTSSEYPWPQFNIGFGHNTGGLDNSHVCMYDSGLWCPANVSATTLYPDVWYTVETYTISSTCSTCRNATVKWWINGQLNGNYTNLNYGSGIVNEWQMNHTWDSNPDKLCGPPTNPSNPVGRDCRLEEIHYFDELVVASIGGLAPPANNNPTPTPVPNALPKPVNLKFL